MMNDFAGLIERREEPAVQDLGTIGAIKAFDESVLIRLARLDVAQFNAHYRTPGGKSLRGQLVPVVQRMAFGHPRQVINCCKVRTTRSAGKLVSISMASASRTPS